MGSGAAVLAAGVGPLVPTGGEAAVAALWWAASAVVGVLWVAGLVSLLRGPLDERRRLPWALTMMLLPGLGALIWFWWRHRHYPARRAAQPDWDPNRRDPVVLPPPRTGRAVPTSIGRPDPYAGHARHPGRLPARRYGAPAEPGE